MAPFTDTNYDLDYDLPMLMLDVVEGDVPPVREVGSTIPGDPTPKES